MKNPTIRKTYNQLRNDITFGKFLPGEHLSEKLLTQEYNVSRASIREIIGQLASQGYLTFEPNRGAVVTKLSLEDIDITYRILSRCESLAAFLAAKAPEKGLLERLRGCHEEMQNCSSDYQKWLRLNDIFHGLIYDHCGSAILTDLIYHTRSRIYRFRMIQTNPTMIKTYNEQHNKILNFIRKNDQVSSERWMMDHLELARKNRFEMFSDLPGLG